MQTRKVFHVILVCQDHVMYPTYLDVCLHHCLASTIKLYFRYLQGNPMRMNPGRPGKTLVPLYLVIITVFMNCTCLFHFSYYMIDRQELKSVRMTQIDIGFYVIPSQASSVKQFTLTVGEIKVWNG